MKKKVFTSILAFCILFSFFVNAQAVQAKTYEADTGTKYTFTGTVKKVKYKNPDPRRVVGKYLTAYLLVLNKPITIKNGFGTEKVKKMDIWADVKNIKKKVGKKIKVKGAIYSYGAMASVSYTGIIINDE